MSKVYIPNNSGHDFSKAEQYGELIFVTQGTIPPFDLNKMYREVVDTLQDSEEQDYIMVSGLTQINGMLMAVFGYKHGRLNLLIYDVKEEDYVIRKIVLGNLIETNDEV